MILTMVGLATLFILLHAEFLGMVQIIVYAGAVMGVFLFVIMLLNLERARSAQSARGFGIILSLAFAVILRFSVILFLQLWAKLSGGNCRCGGSTDRQRAFHDLSFAFRDSVRC